MENSKLRVLFVDDEKKILDGLRRKLRSMRNVWDISFALGGAEAINILKERRLDVVVTDMRMPQISGYELLKIVQKEYPFMIRIVLSGYSDSDVVMKTTQLVHQYLSKPTSIERIKAAIERAISLRSLLKNRRLSNLAAQLKSIPVIPAIYDKMIKEISKEDSSLVKVGKIIEQDPGMSAKMMQIVNSSFFGTARHIESPSHAVVMLGLEIVKGLVLSINIFSKFNNSVISNKVLKDIQEHSFIVAKYAQRIAQYLKLDSYIVDFTYTAGLLHEVGRLVLLSEFSEIYNGIIRESTENNSFLHDLEIKEFNASHSELGAYIMGIWGLEYDIINAIAFQSNPSAYQGIELDAVVCLHIANIYENIKHQSKYMMRNRSYDMEVLKKFKLEKVVKKLDKILD